MLSLRLPQDLMIRLESLAKRTGKPKSYYLKIALEEHLNDLEDAFIALERLATPTKRMSLEEVEKAIR